MPLFSLPTLLVVGGLVLADVLFWAYQGRLMQNSGHLPWRRSLIGHVIWKSLTPVFAKYFVGDITVVGREKLRGLRGRRVFVQNHTFQMDFVLASVATACHFFYMVVTSELRGIRGMLGALTGAIPVNVKEAGGGAAAVNASVKALCGGRRRCLLIFPQGGLKAQFPLDRAEFQKGAVRIAQLTAATTGEDVWMVPLGTCYIHADEETPLTVRSKLMRKTRKLFGVPCLGAVVVVGDAVKITALPGEEDAAVDVLFEKINALTAEAMAIAEEKRKALKSA